MAKQPRLPSFRKSDPAFDDPDRGKVWTVRFIIAVALFVLGVAWIAYTYVGVRPDEGWLAIDLTSGEEFARSGPKFMQDLENWNYLIGFIGIFLGLILAAHPSTPMGRGRGVVVGMLGCFIVGLIWICLYYIFLTGDDPTSVPVLNDLGQKNLFVGIGFMAVGFTFATRWE